ncbi:Putative ribonuclease H protein [Dendrobium catenatum]|uniref:Ribonuclease H protein n=1 Tax=Dendrobium catenatum TaxID=906689 RepID=A0A2I0V9V5_9ASPA|nr:Putative ribonuclease H protein [Dendrobium catenatum]
MAVTIIWFIWMDRNDAKYRNITMNHKRIIARTKEKINILYKANLFKNCHFRGFKFVIKKLCNVYVENKEEAVSKFVKWIKPKESVIKINTDGSVATGKWGCGGILRNADGILVFYFAGPLSSCSVPFAEVIALYQALKIALSKGILRVWIEVDALLVYIFLILIILVMLRIFIFLGRLKVCFLRWIMWFLIFGEKVMLVLIFWLVWVQV